ncbi:uncharacterized protein N0V89_012512 [Didymosphaeria variabile]|uniref:Uncharacterized protein n=1 Tax=Didymosphaeria variabile TaxID=1932322 RepID=A0A9W8X9D4_9PLEO|nr:uncharacterized protein N0V89_012512 [Didymosphaeria variabile]KAJ4344768.1 hypothetical protein N0V89_012512 [Didymosphaeria variabile]
MAYVVFVEYARTIGDGEIAERNLKFIALMVKDLHMVEVDEGVGRIGEVAQKLHFLEADEVFAELGALQIVTLFVQYQQQTMLYGNVAWAKLTRDDTVVGVRFSEVSAYTGLRRVATFRGNKAS